MFDCTRLNFERRRGRHPRERNSARGPQMACVTTSARHRPVPVVRRIPTTATDRGDGGESSMSPGRLIACTSTGRRDRSWLTRRAMRAQRHGGRRRSSPTRGHSWLMNAGSDCLALGRRRTHAICRRISSLLGECCRLDQHRAARSADRTHGGSLTSVPPSCAAAALLRRPARGGASGCALCRASAIASVRAIVMFTPRDLQQMPVAPDAGGSTSVEQQVEQLHHDLAPTGTRSASRSSRRRSRRCSRLSIESGDCSDCTRLRRPRLALLDAHVAPLVPPLEAGEDLVADGAGPFGLVVDADGGAEDFDHRARAPGCRRPDR